MKKNSKILLNIALIAVMFFTALTFPKAEAVVETFENDEVLVEVTKEYNAEEKKETIALSVTNKLETVTVKRVELPDGEVQEKESGTYTYVTAENTNSVFKVQYTVEEEGIITEKEFEVSVITDSIEEVEEPTTSEIPVTPYSTGFFDTDTEGTWWVEQDGSLEVRILNYNPSVGWKAGVAYQVKVIVNFGSLTGTGREIIINLPEGMKYVEYPVIGATGSPQSEMVGVNADVMANIIAPTANPYYQSHNGTLTYQLKDTGVDKIAISFQATPDVALYYGEKTFAEGIKVTAMKEGSSIGTAAVVVNATGEVNFRAGTTGEPSSYQYSGVANSDISANTLASTLTRFGDYYQVSLYYKKVTTYFYYPKEINVLSMNHAAYCSAADPLTGLIVCEYNNHYGTNSNAPRMTYNLVGVAAGNYVADEKIKVSIEMYDGTIIEQELANPLEVTVVDESEVVNKLSLETANRAYYNLSDDYLLSGPSFRISSDMLADKTNQHVEITIDPNFQVEQVILPYDQTEITSVWYKTNLNATLREATGAELVVTDKSVAITKDSLNLLNGETIIYVEAELGDFSAGYYSVRSINYIAGNYFQVLGKLVDGVTLAEVTAKIYATSDSGVVIAGTESEATGKIFGRDFYSASLAVPVSNLSITAGNTGTVDFELYNTAYFYTDTLATVNPKLYIELLDNVTYTNIVAVSDVAGNLAVDTQEVTSSTTGKKYLEISITGEAGSYFNGNQPKITVSVDVEAGVQAKGSYKWTDIAFWDYGADKISAHNGYPTEVKNVITTDDVMAPVQAEKNLIISAKEALIVDTYIVPEGEDRQPAYNETSDSTKLSTAVGFTPGTVATYTVDIFNNLKSTVNEVGVYIPVPKEGNNYGSDFQTNSFIWNMKLDATPVLTVYDSTGTDITSSKGSNYILEYSTTATNQTNYTTGYSGSFSNDTTMIRVTNTAGVAPGEKAVITFKYVVDETPTSVQGTAKLGAINDFMPYYLFDAETSGSSSGTKVGALLEIGVISGKVWVDKDYDGIKNGSDTFLTTGTVELFKADGSSVGTATLNSSGEYKFENLAAGTYKLDFSGVLNSTNYKYFTFKEVGTAIDTNSLAYQTGTNTGFVLNVDPTQESSKVINVGVLDYNPNDLTVSGSAVTVKAANSQNSGTSSAITVTTNNTNFDKIKAISGAYGYVSNATTTAIVNSSGVVTGVATGNTTVTITVTDLFGNSITGTANVTVVANNLPEITFTTNPLELTVGGTYNPLTGVSVSDVEDGTALTTADLVVTGDTVNTTVADVYTITYSITDSDGNTTTKDRTVVVNDGSIIIKDEYIFKGINFAVAVADVDTSDSETQIVSLADVEVYDKLTGVEVPFDITDGGYTNVESIYTITVNPTAKPTETHSFKAIVLDGNVTVGENYVIQSYDVEIGLKQAEGISNADLIDFTSTKVIEIATTNVISNGAEVVSHDVIAEADDYTASFKVSLEPTTTVSSTITVSDKDVVVIGEEYAISANYFKVGTSEVAGLLVADSNLITRAGAISWKKADNSSAGVIVVSHTITETPGTYQITFAVLEEPATTATIEVEVIKGKVVEGDEYYIVSNDLNVGLKQVEELISTDANLIAQTKTTSYKKIDDSSAGVTVIGHTILTTTGNYTATFAVTEELATEITVDVNVLPYDIVVDTEEYLFVANYFEVGISEVTTLTNNQLIARANAQAIRKSDNTIVDVELVSNGMTSTEGTYDVSFKITEAPTVVLTTKATVRPEEIVVEGNEYSIAANNINLYKTEADTITDAELISYASANAWKKADNSMATVAVDSHSVIGVDGTYSVTFYVVEEPTTKITISVEVKTVVYHLESHDVIQMTAAELNNCINTDCLEDTILELSSAAAWKHDPYSGIEEISVSIPELSHVVAIKDGGEVTVNLQVLNTPKGFARFTTIQTEELILATKEVKIIVVPAPTTPNPSAPSTGVDGGIQLATIGLLAGCLLLQLGLKKRKESN